MEKNYTISSVSELADFAKDFVSQLSTLNSSAATVVALSGDLGAGKTTLVQLLAKELGIIETVTSPTFTIMKGYEITSAENFSKLIHMDAYRIEDLNEVEPLRLSELMSEPRTLLCIEWAEKISSTLPKDTHFLNIESGQDEVRKITCKRGK